LPQRLDRPFADVNAFLLALAIGLAVLDPLLLRDGLCRPDRLPSAEGRLLLSRTIWRNRAQVQTPVFALLQKRV
jgi:hypothetical protein